MEHSDTQSCKTCEALLSGAYCSQCGQKVIRQRLTVRQLFTDLFSQITNVDRGLWYTASMLFRNPGKVIRDYIGGSTVKYSSPVRYLLIWITISFLVYFGFGLHEQQAAEMTEAFNQDYTARQLVFQEKWGNIVKNYAQVFGMILVPIYAIFSRMLFRRQGLNYAEHLVANAYFSAQAALIGSLLNPLILLTTDRFLLSLLFGFSVSIAYYTVGLRSLFAQRWIPAFFKTLLIIFFGFIGYSIVLSIVGAVVGIIFAMSGNI